MNLAKFLPFEWSSDELNKEIDLLRREIVERVHPKSIFLFGSAAEGDLHRGSDVDLAILVTSKEKIKETVQRLHALPVLSHLSLDLLVFDVTTFVEKSEIGGVCQSIREEGKLLFDEEKGFIDDSTSKRKNF